MAKRTSTSQFEIMLDYFEKYPQMLSGKVDSTFSKETKDKRWRELASILNAEGNGPSKSIAVWRKTLKDWKCYVKKKAGKIALQQKQTGDGKPAKEKLSVTEEKLLAAIDEFAAHGQIHVAESPIYGDVDLDVSIDTDVMDPLDDVQNCGNMKAVKRKIKDSLAAEVSEILINSQNESQRRIVEVTERKEKMRIVIDTNLLIKEIEQRPAIWDMKLADYSDKLARKRCWEELTEIFSPAKISEKEKKALNELLQKIWRNIRDRFARDSKCGGGEKSQYIYTPLLQFLKNSTRIRKYPISVSDVVPMARKALSTSENVYGMSEEESEPLTEKSTTTSLDSSTSSDILDVPEGESKPSPEKRKRTDNSIVETKLIEFLERNMMELQDTTKNNQDEDRLFLLSLLTNLKSIQPVYKLKAKIEILTILDKYPKIHEESDIVHQPQILEVRHSVDP